MAKANRPLNESLWVGVLGFVGLFANAALVITTDKWRLAYLISTLCMLVLLIDWFHRRAKRRAQAPDD